jgi:isohexenylglutaconyl-CoA hydratase
MSQMLTPHIHIEEPLLGIKRCRFKEKLLSSPLLYELIETLDELLISPPRLFVLEGPEGCFCQGLDLKEIAAPQAAISELFLHMLQKLLRLPCLTAAWVGGEASSEGFALAFAADITLASQNAFFALPQLQRGLVPALSYPFLKGKLASHLIDQMALTGGSVSAERAYALGWLYKIGEKEPLIDAISKEAVHSSPEAAALFKSRFLSPPSHLQALTDALSLHLEAKKTPHAHEGIEAFLHKQTPSWDS